ncbi:MAG: ABC transporter substrate-binding protein [Nocardioidaceae bacterium]
MRITRTKALVAVVAVAALGVTAACGSGANKSGGSGSEPKLSNAAVGHIADPSDKAGGTIKFGLGGEWGDSVDPGDTYYGYSWDMLRNYARTLVTFKTEPGKAGNELVPDLAEDLGVSSEGGKTWTYKLKSGLKFEDGSAITSKDIAYAVKRTMATDVLKQGPTYFGDMLNWPADYKGPYKQKDADVSSAIETPDDQTIVFHLKQPFGGFDYLAQLPQTAPVPAAKDTGIKYKDHVISSGPYKFEGNYNPASGFTLVRNDQWDKSTDDIRRALPDKMTVKLNMQADDVDNQIIAGTLDVDIAGTGVQPAALSKVLNTRDLQDRADNPTLARTWYTSIPGTVKPLDNIECRKAIIYGMDATSFQNAYGGKYAGGEIAGGLLPPMIPGYVESDPWGIKANPTGQPDKAKEALKKCGKPDGFSINMGYRSERPKEKAVAEAFQQALGKVGIKVTPQAMPDGTYFSEQCGNPGYVVTNNVGLCANGWGADWNDGFGFLSQIVDSRVIKPQGGSSNISVRIPEVDKLLDKAIPDTNVDNRNQIWGEIDKLVSDSAYVYPGIYARSVLLRSKNTTNVFVNEAYGYYDYTAMGAK